MYKYHEESLQIMTTYYREQKGVIAFIFGRSVAKGMERVDSDLDGIDDAILHVSEILESKQSYGLECLLESKVVGFILGSTMLFHYGRFFEINDLAVLPDYQRKGIATKLLECCLAEMEERGIKGVNLITANEGMLPEFYGKHGFERENGVILMARKIE